MIDLVKLKLLAGNGGDGRVSLLREKSRPKGGPDGGNGGQGGSIFLQADKDLNTLKQFAGVREISAKPGEMGGKNKKHGGDGEDAVVKVPLGTVIWLVQENHPSYQRRKRFEKSSINFDFDQEGDLENAEGTELEAVMEDGGSSKIDPQETSSSPFRLNVLFNRNVAKYRKYYFDEAGKKSGTRGSEADLLTPVDFGQERVLTKVFSSFDKITDNSDSGVRVIKLAELKQEGEQIVLCQGGLGGRGNHTFRSSVNQTPREAEYGTYGEKKEIILELRLLADLGLVGLPNAGKSTLLSRLTKAKPKIANYPFTTIEPNLGVLVSKDGKKELVVADVPGLIEGASLGKGLGDRFLRHLENCQTLLFVLFLEEEVVFDQSLDHQQLAEKLFAQYVLLQQELEAFSPDLLSKPSIVTVNKKDLYSKELVETVQQFFAKLDVNTWFFSGVTGEGLDGVTDAVFKLVKKLDRTKLE